MVNTSRQGAQMTFSTILDSDYISNRVESIPPSLLCDAPPPDEHSLPEVIKTHIISFQLSVVNDVVQGYCMDNTYS